MLDEIDGRLDRDEGSGVQGDSEVLLGVSDRRIGRVQQV